MASLSTATLRFQPMSINQINQINGARQSIAVAGWGKSSLPTLRISRRMQISCAAKPETVERVIDVVRKQLALGTDVDVTAETTFEKLGADSLDTVEIVMALEEAYDISVEEDNAQSISNIQDAADVIEKLLEKTAA